VVVQPALFMAGQGAKAGSIAYSEPVSPTLKGCASGLNQAPSVVAFAQNQRDEVRDLNGVAGALSAEPGMKQQTFIAQPVIALQANGIDRALTAGCNGAGWRENEMYTLNTIDRHAVVFENHGQDSRYTGPLSVSQPVTSTYGMGGNNQPFVVEHYQDVVGALCSTDYKWVQQQQQVEQGKLIVTNRDKDKRYIVRRLMPLETTRLQGYPDWWHDLAPFDGDVAFWESVRETWARITGATYKPFASIERLEKWYYGLRTEGAEYKVDGNSLAIPCAAYVIRRIAEIYKQEGLTFDT